MVKCYKQTNCQIELKLFLLFITSKSIMYFFFVLFLAFFLECHSERARINISIGDYRKVDIALSKHFQHEYKKSLDICLALICYMADIP